MSKRLNPAEILRELEKDTALTPEEMDEELEQDEFTPDGRSIFTGETREDYKTGDYEAETFLDDIGGFSGEPPLYSLEEPLPEDELGSCFFGDEHDDPKGSLDAEKEHPMSCYVGGWLYL